MRIARLIACVGLGASAVASAGLSVPALNMALSVGNDSGTDSWNWNPQGEHVGNNAKFPSGLPANDGMNFQYVGAGSWGGLALDWNIVANPDPFVFALIGVTNNTNATQTISLITTLPIAPAITPSSLIGGSTQGGLTADADGGVLASVPGGFMYRAMIDGVAVGGIADLLGGVSVPVGPFLSGTTGPASFGNPIPSAPGPAAFTTIGIEHTFTLTPGDRATFTSSFVVVVPSAGALSVFGVAGVFASRRRRA